MSVEEPLIQTDDSSRLSISSESSRKRVGSDARRVSSEHFSLDWRNRFPKVFCPDKLLDVANVLKSHGITEPVPPHSVSGPALPVAFWATAASWTFHAIFPWAAWSLCRCTDEQQANPGQADFPNTVWYIIIPYLIFLLVLEWRCMRWTLLPQFQVVGHLDFMGFSLSWHLWTVATYSLSFISHMDLATNGLFMITILKTSSCSAGAAFERLWEDTMRQSAFSYLHMSIKFDCLAFMLWLLMFSQLIFAVVAAIPLQNIHALVKGTPLIGLYNWLATRVGWVSPPHDVVYEVADMESILQYVSEGKPMHGTAYQTLLDSNFSTSDHVSALFALAEANRMVSITSMRNVYSHKKAFYFIDKNQPQLACYLLRRHMQMWQQKVLLVGVFENAFQLNLQISNLAMLYHITGNHLDALDVVSISAGIVMAFKNTFNAYKGQQWIAKALHEDIETSATSGMRNMIYKALIRLRVFLGIYLIFIIYAFAKLVAIPLCPGSMFNITGCAAV